MKFRPGIDKLGYGAFDHDVHGCPKCPDGLADNCTCWCSSCVAYLGGIADGKTPCPGCGKT